MMVRTREGAGGLRIQRSMKVAMGLWAMACACGVERTSDPAPSHVISVSLEADWGAYAKQPWTEQIQVRHVSIALDEARLLGAHPRIPAGGWPLLATSQVVAASGTSGEAIQLSMPEAYRDSEDLALFLRVAPSAVLEGASVEVVTEVDTYSKIQGFLQQVRDVEAPRDDTDPDIDLARDGRTGVPDPDIDPAQGKSGVPDPDIDPAHGEEGVPDPDIDPAQGEEGVPDPDIDPAQDEEGVPDPDIDPAQSEEGGTVLVDCDDENDGMKAACGPKGEGSGVPDPDIDPAMGGVEQTSSSLTSSSHVTAILRSPVSVDLMALLDDEGRLRLILPLGRWLDEATLARLRSQAKDSRQSVFELGDRRYDEALEFRLEAPEE